jgi:hypothetical protein
MTIQGIATCAACEHDARHARRYECTGDRLAGVLIASLSHFYPPAGSLYTLTMASGQSDFGRLGCMQMLLLLARVIVVLTQQNLHVE